MSRAKSRPTAGGNPTQGARAQLRAAQAAQAAKKRRNRIIATAAIVTVVVAAIVVAVVLLKPGPVSTADREPGVASPGAPTQPPNANSTLRAIVANPGKASDSAPLVELFFDYQCPMCHTLETAIGPSLDALADSGAIRLEYRSMTFLDQMLGNDSSSRPAIAAACADTVGSYTAYHNQVFANQPAHEGDGYTDDVLLTTIPAAIGLTGEKLAAFQQCYTQRATAAFVAAVDEQAFADGVTGTPTIRVNGKNFDFSAAYADPSMLGPLIAQAAG